MSLGSFLSFNYLAKTKTKLHGLSPRANYTEHRLSAKWLPTFADRGNYLANLMKLKKKREKFLRDGRGQWREEGTHKWKA
jgi:hypothetical protein